MIKQSYVCDEMSTVMSGTKDNVSVFAEGTLKND
jgi:hypothetical protein